MNELVVKIVEEGNNRSLGYFFRICGEYYHLNGQPLLSQTELSKSDDFLTFKFTKLSDFCQSLPLLVTLRNQKNEVLFCLFANGGKDENGVKLVDVISFSQPDQDLLLYSILEYCFIVSTDEFANSFSYKLVKALDELMQNRLPLNKLKKVVLRPKILS